MTRTFAGHRKRGHASGQACREHTSARDGSCRAGIARFGASTAQSTYNELIDTSLLKDMPLIEMF